MPGPLHPQAPLLPGRWTGDVDTFVTALGAAWGSADREEALLRWLEHSSPAAWAALDEAARSWSRPECPVPPGLPSTLAVGWRSFSYDGHVREAATRALAGDPHEVAPGFLILRCDDWVGPVRRLAQDAVRRLAAEGLLRSGRWLPLLITRAQRSRSGELFRAILETIPLEAVSELLTHEDALVRREALARVLAHALDAATLQRLLGPVRDAALARPLSARLIAVADEAVLAAMLLDPRVIVRRAAWEQVALQPGFPLPEAILTGGLLHPSPTLRSLAQRVARARLVDAAGIYRACPTDSPPQRRRRLQGLDECGAPEVLDLARSALTDADDAVRATAIGVWVRRHPEPGRLLVDLLPTARGSALRAVVRGVLSRRPPLPATTLAHLRQGSPEQRRAAWVIARSQGRWQRLHAGLIAMNDEDEPLSRVARADVHAWFVHAYPRAGAPPAELRGPLAAMLTPSVPHVELLRFALRG